MKYISIIFLLLSCEEDAETQHREFADSSSYYLQKQTYFLELQSAAAIQYSETKDEKYFDSVKIYYDSASKYYQFLKDLKEPTTKQ